MGEVVLLIFAIDDDIINIDYYEITPVVKE